MMPTTEPRGDDKLAEDLELDPEVTQGMGEWLQWDK